MAFFGPLKLSESQQGNSSYISQLGQMLAQRLPGISGLTAYPGSGGTGTGSLGFTYNSPSQSGMLEGINAVSPESLTALLAGAGAPASVEDLAARINPVVSPERAAQITPGLFPNGANPLQGASGTNPDPFASTRPQAPPPPPASSLPSALGAAAPTSPASSAPTSDPYLRSLQQAGFVNDAPNTQSGGGGDSVICTELYRQGYMSLKFYEADAAFGKTLPREIYRGYRRWADHIVPVMKRSRLITHVVSLIATPWMVHMAYVMGASEKDSRVGKLIMKVGKNICARLGKLPASEPVSSMR